MFAFARRKTHSQLAKAELSQSLAHFRSAATHAAKGTGATVGPKVNAARNRVSPAAGKVRNVASSGWGTALAALAPLATAAADGARQAGSTGRKVKAKNAKEARKLDKKAMKAMKAADKKRSDKKGSKLTTLLMAGAAVGAAGALVARRRKQQQWDEYDPGRPAGGARTEERAVETPMPAAMAPQAVGTLEQPTATVTDTAPTITGPAITEPTADQTQSALHNPNVARMASGARDTER